MRSILLVFTALLVVRCNAPDYLADPPNRLSTYGLFEGVAAAQQPVEGVVAYAVNSQLFADYAVKYRFIKLPGGRPAVYDRTQTFDMPVGTIIAKTFSYPKDVRDLTQGERLLETRLLIHGKDGWGGQLSVRLGNQHLAPCHYMIEGIGLVTAARDPLECARPPACYMNLVLASDDKRRNSEVGSYELA